MKAKIPSNHDTIIIHPKLLAEIHAKNLDFVNEYKVMTNSNIPENQIFTADFREHNKLFEPSIMNNLED